jgi:hypothetical protein
MPRKMKPAPHGLEGSAPADWSHPYKVAMLPPRLSKKKRAVAATPVFEAEGWGQWRKLYGTVKQSMLF